MSVKVKIEPGALWPGYVLSNDNPRLPYRPAYFTIGRTIVRGKPTRTASEAKSHAREVLARYTRLTQAAEAAQLGPKIAAAIEEVRRNREREPGVASAEEFGTPTISVDPASPIPGTVETMDGEPGPGTRIEDPGDQA